MITPPTTEELALLAQSTFADTAFLITDLALDATPAAPDWLCVVVGFDAAVKGRLVLAAPSGLAAQLAADMLCIDASDEQALAQASGALAELANVFAGVLAPRVYGEKGQWVLGLPRVLLVEPALGAHESARAVTLMSDAGHPIHIELVLEQQAA
jgi:CheY-specific phosphatase CheX